MLPPIATQFVAGETAATAISHAHTLTEQGINPMLNLLGSHHADRERAVADAREYQRVIGDLGAADLTAAVSVKPTQLGLDYSEELCTALLGDIVETAADHGVLVWLDMEEPTTTDATLDAYERFASVYDGLGICLQADLHRTPADLDRVADCPGKLRLVKGGAYDNPDSIAYTKQAAIDRAYRRLLDQAIETATGTVAVASHDPAMIEYAIDRHDRAGEPAIEFQLLMGVRPDAQRELAAEYDCWQYVPYGPRWKRWAINRAKQNVGLAARAIADNATAASTVLGFESPRE